MPSINHITSLLSDDQFFSLALMLLAAFAAFVIADSMKDNIKQELTQFNDAYNELVTHYDLEAFVALYGDAPLWIAPTMEPVQGLNVSRRTFQFIMDNEGQLVHTFDEFHVSKDGTQAMMIAQYKVDIEAVGLIRQALIYSCLSVTKAIGK